MLSVPTYQKLLNKLEDIKLVQQY